MTPQELETSKQVEEAWRRRALSQHLKPHTQAYKKAEVEFFIGAMTAINALNPNPDPIRLSTGIPPHWVIMPISGRNIVEL